MTPELTFWMSEAIVSFIGFILISMFCIYNELKLKRMKRFIQNKHLESEYAEFSIIEKELNN